MICIVCGSEDRKRMFDNLVRCEHCDLIYYDKNSDGKKLENLYQEGYFKGEEYLDYENDKVIIQKNFSHRMKEIRRYVSKGTLFEIGCAYGFFLDLAQKHFSAEGIDIAKTPTEFARKELKLNVKTGSYLDTKLEETDVFCMWDTIEHLEHPEKYIEKIGSELKKGGYLFLTTGDIGSMLAKFRGRKWRMIHPPTHLYYFSKETIRKLLEQHGLEIVSVTHPGVYRSLRQMFYSLFLLNRKRAPKMIENVFNKVDFPIYLNTFDIMMVVARKK